MAGRVNGGNHCEFGVVDSQYVSGEVKEMETNEYDVNKPFWQSKRWWLAVIAVLIPIASHALGWELDTGEIMAVITPIVVYILGQSYVDAKH